jgi:signal peptidase I
MKLRWFLSGKVRRATDLYKHVRKLLDAQRDILSPQAVSAVDGALASLKKAIDSDDSDDALAKRSEELEKTANKWLRPYPHAEWRENVEVFLVAIVVAMGIRTFFLQPFKIPTGSMQPTLYGVVLQDLRNDPNFQMPGPLTRIFDAAVRGVIYHQIIAQADGEVLRVAPLEHFMRFINKQTILVQYVGGPEVPVTVWFAPDEGFERRAGVEPGYQFHKGEPFIRFKETTGDHLFVDRVTYNFRHPERGEIIVFKTLGIPLIPNQDQFYIKRLVGLGGETITIGEDRHVRIDGRRLDASTPHFENIYGFDPHVEPRSGQYSGHTLDARSHFRSPSDSYTVRPRHYFAMGDNTVDSADSRYWDDLPEENVIGKAWFVYWPISPRFGWGQR